MGWGSKQKGTRQLRAGVFGEREEGLLHSAGRQAAGCRDSQPRAALQKDPWPAARVRASAGAPSKPRRLEGGREMWGVAWQGLELGWGEEAPLRVERSHRWPGWGRAGGLGLTVANYKKPESNTGSLYQN